MASNFPKSPQLLLNPPPYPLAHPHPHSQTPQSNNLNQFSPSDILIKKTVTAFLTLPDQFFAFVSLVIVVFVEEGVVLGFCVFVAFGSEIGEASYCGVEEFFAFGCGDELMASAEHPESQISTKTTYLRIPQLHSLPPPKLLKQLHQNLPRSPRTEKMQAPQKLPERSLLTKKILIMDRNFDYSEEQL